jgi:hypothetical protein
MPSPRSEKASAAFGNLYAYDGAIVPWLNELADECYRQGEADDPIGIVVPYDGSRSRLPVP